MDSRYFVLVRDLTEAAHLATVMAKNVNYNDALDTPSLDDLDRLIVQTGDIIRVINRNISEQHYC